MFYRGATPCLVSVNKAAHLILEKVVARLTTRPEPEAAQRAENTELRAIGSFMRGGNGNPRRPYFSSP